VQTKVFTHHALLGAARQQPARRLATPPAVLPSNGPKIDSASPPRSPAARSSTARSRRPACQASRGGDAPRRGAVLGALELDLSTRLRQWRLAGWFSGPAFSDDIETHELDGAPVRIYDPEKPLVDSFRYRNQIGMDVVLEALKLWRERRRKKLDALLKYACMRHVERAMRPYLEAMS
jgi:hypothetical protein